MKRRTLLSMTATTVAVTAGCSGNSDGNGDGTDTGNGDETGPGSDGECEQEVLVDATETVVAGEALTYTFELTEGWTLDMIVEQANEGAQPTVQLEAPDGTLELDRGPAELIYEVLELGSSGEYSLRILNEDPEESGEFDVRVDYVSPGC